MTFLHSVSEYQKIEHDARKSETYLNAFLLCLRALTMMTRSSSVSCTAVANVSLMFSLVYSVAFCFSLNSAFMVSSAGGTASQASMLPVH